MEGISSIYFLLVAAASGEELGEPAGEFGAVCPRLEDALLSQVQNFLEVRWALQGQERGGCVIAASS